MLITVLLTALVMANVLLLFALICTGRKVKDAVSRIGFSFMAVVLVLDMFASLGGVLLW